MPTAVQVMDDAITQTGLADFGDDSFTDGTKDGPAVEISFHVEATMVAPPWVQGALRSDVDTQLKTTAVRASTATPPSTRDSSSPPTAASSRLARRRARG